MRRRCGRSFGRSSGTAGRAGEADPRAYLGPKYSFSHLAAIDRFGDGPDLTPVATIKAVFESLHFHQTDYGIVPIENSTDGRIVDTLDMFARLPTRITGKCRLRFTITCSANVAGRSDRGLASRRRRRSAASGWQKTCRRRKRWR